MKFIVNLFNPHPADDGKLFINSRGQKIRIVNNFGSSRPPKVRAYFNRRPIGHINSHLVTLVELFIEDISVKKEFRRTGIGKAMLQEFILVANHSRVKELKGFILGHDGENDAYIVEWNKRQGFTLEEVNPGRFVATMNLKGDIN